MTTLIAPTEGGVAHVARCLADNWPSGTGSVGLIGVNVDGVVAFCRCGRTPPRRAFTAWMPTAWVAAAGAWTHRRCLRSGSGLHVELGLLSVGPLWFALAASVISRRTLVVGAHDVPRVVLHPAAALAPRGPGARDAVAYRLVARLFDSLVFNLFRQRTRATVVLSHRAADQAYTAGWPGVVVAEHGAEPPTPGNLTPDLAGYVLLAGYLGPGKGLDILVRAWRELPSEGRLPLVVAGGHSDTHAEWVAQRREELNAADPTVRWAGRVDDDAFADLIRNSAIVVVPYEKSNPASGIVVRALVEGRAVVGTRVPAVTDEIQHGVDGLVVEPGDSGGLASALYELMSSPSLRASLGATAQRRAVERHQWVRHASTVAAAQRRQPDIPSQAEPKTDECRD